MDNTLAKQFDYYLSHQDEIVRQYAGKYVVIADGAVIGAYDDEMEAITTTQKTRTIGTFLVQKAEQGKAAYTQTFHSRVAFVDICSNPVTA